MYKEDNKPRDRAAKKAFPTPADLEKLVDEYIEITTNTTSIQWVRFAHSIEQVERPVSVGIYDFCHFAKIHSDTLRTYRQKNDYTAPIGKLYDYIYKRADILHDNGLMSARTYANVTAHAKEYQVEKEQATNVNTKQIIVTFGEAKTVQIDDKPVDTSVSGESIDFNNDDYTKITQFKPTRKEKY